MTSLAPTVPWSLSEARAAFFAEAAGAVLLGVSWWGSSGSATPGRQATWADVGVLGLALIVLGSLVWVASGRTAVARRRDELVGRLEQVAASTPIGVAATAGRTVVRLPASRRYHAADCVLVLGKSAREVAPGADELDGLDPCEMCEP